MLFVDDDPVTLNDLLSMEPEVSDVAASESIIISGNSGVIRRGKENAQAKLARFMSFSGLAINDLTLRDINMPVGTPDMRYNYAGFAQIVVTGEANDNWSSLKRWMVATALCQFYSTATNKNRDRYSDKYESCKDDLIRDYWPNLRRRGIPILFNPLEAPGAIMGRAGRFSSSNISMATGAGTSLLGYDFAVTWVGSKYVSPTVKNNSESYRSVRGSITGINGKVARVSISGLTPPNGTQPAFTQSSCRYTPGVAVGWNVWACRTPDPAQSLALGTDFDYPVMYRQNASVLPLSQLAFDLPGDPVLSGEQLDFGQNDEIVLEIRSELQRC